MRRILAAFVLALTVLSCAPAVPAVRPTTITTQRQGDPNVTVWVNTNSSVYHCPGTRWYGNTKEGKYMSQKAAQVAGYRPAYGSVCG
jgi:hypothetical protein